MDDKGDTLADRSAFARRAYSARSHRYNCVMRGIGLLLATTMLAACQRAPAPMQHEAYVWQREWTDAVNAALSEGRGTFSAYRILAAESRHDGTLVTFARDFAAIERLQQPVVAVIRINGSDPVPVTRELSARVAAIARDWRAAGLRLTGVEIDFDCATSRLPEYSSLLAQLRSSWPAGLTLSITALPAWLESPALAALLAGVDASVLQVHSVQAPAAGLFDPDAAQRWIDAYATKSAKPFDVAMPAYGLRVGFDAGGRAIAAEGEVPRDAPDDARELRVDPEKVARLLRNLERERPPQVRDVVWFRLPTEQDRRAWSLPMLRAVIAGDPLKPVVKVTFDAAADGSRDLVLANVGVVDAQAPARLVVAAYGCSAGDALAGFRLERSGDDWRFVSTSDTIVRAGRERRIGWLRCETVAGVKIDETP